MANKIILSVLQEITANTRKLNASENYLDITVLPILALKSCLYRLNATIQGDYCAHMTKQAYGKLHQAGTIRRLSSLYSLFNLESALLLYVLTIK